MSTAKQRLAQERNWDKARLKGIVASLENIKHNFTNSKIVDPSRKTSSYSANLTLAISFAKDALKLHDEASIALGLKVKTKTEVE